MSKPILYPVVVQIRADSAVDAQRQVNAFSKSLEKAQGAANKSRKSIGLMDDSVGVLNRGLNLSTRLFHNFSAALGVGISLSFIGAIRHTIDWNNQLLAGRRHFLAYGEGISALENRLGRMGDKFKFTRQETLALSKTFATAFVAPDMGKLDDITTALARVSGNNEQEINRMLSSLASLSQAFPELERTVMTSFKDGVPLSSKSAEDLQSKLMTAANAGRITNEVWKDVSGIIHGVSEKATDLSNIERKRLEEAQKFKLAQQEIKKLYDDIQVTVGSKLLPILTSMASWLDKHTDTILKISGYVMPVIIGLASLKGLKLLGDVTGFSKRSSIDDGGPGGLAGGLIKSATPIPVLVMNPGFGGAKGGTSLIGGGSKVAGQAGKLGKLGRLAHLRNAVARAPLPLASIAAVGGVAGHYASKGTGNLIDSTFGKRAKETYAGNATTGLASIGAGAAAGAAIGSVVPVVGTALGAAVGGSAGAGVEAFKSWKEGQEYISGVNDDLEITNFNMQKHMKNVQSSGDVWAIELETARQAMMKLDEEVIKAKSGFWYRFMGIGSGEVKELEAKAEIARSELDKKRKEASGDGYFDEQKKRIEGQDKLNKKTDEEKKKQEELAESQRQSVLGAKILNSIIEDRSKLLQTQLSIYSSTFEIIRQGGAGVAGSFEKSQAGLKEANDRISTQISLLEIAKAKEIENAELANIDLKREGRGKEFQDARAAFESGGTQEEKTDAISGYADSVRDLLMAQQKIAEIDQKSLGFQQKKISLALEYSSILDSGIERQQSEASIIESQIQLADNLAMGVAASAEMRMQSVRALGDVITEQRNKLSVIDKQISDISAQEANSLQEQEIKQATLNQLSIDRNKTENEIYQNINKQAQMTKVLRDGWVSAINAMNNGVGMFTKIKIDSSTRLGTLMSNAPKPVVGIRTGFSGDGKRESSSFSALAPGHLTNPDKAGRSFGATSDEWAAAIDKRSPLGFTGGSGNPFSAGGLDQMSHGMGMWNELIGKNLSTFGAAAETPFGTSGLTSEISDGSVDKLSNAVKSGVEAGISNIAFFGGLAGPPKGGEVESPDKISGLREGYADFKDRIFDVRIVGSTVTVPVEMNAIERNSGGYVPGNLNENKDSTAAFLTPGEFVISKEAAQALGARKLNQLNNGEIKDMDQLISADRSSKSPLLNERQEKSSRFISGIDLRGVSPNPIFDYNNLNKEFLAYKSDLDNVDWSKIADMSQVELFYWRKYNYLPSRDKYHDLSKKKVYMLAKIVQDMNNKIVSNKETKTNERARKERRIKSQIQYKEGYDKSKTPEGLEGILGGLNRWWDDSMGWSGPPTAIDTPPTRKTAPDLFNALDYSTVLSPGLDYNEWQGDDWAKYLRAVMLEGDGLNRNKFLKGFSYGMERQIKGLKSVFIPSAEDKINSYKDNIEKAQYKDNIEKAQTIDFLPRYKIKEMEHFRDYESEKLEGYNEHLNMASRMKMFSDFAFMPLVDSYKDPRGGDGRRGLTYAERDDIEEIKYRKENSYFGGLSKQSNSDIISNLPISKVGLRAAYYADGIKNVISGGFLDAEKKTNFEQVITGKLDDIKENVYNKEYEDYKGTILTQLENTNYYFENDAQLKSPEFYMPYEDFVVNQNPDWSQYDIPQFAKGGFVSATPGGQLSVIGEGSEDEIVSPVSMMRSMADDAAMKSAKRAGMGGISSSINNAVEDYPAQSAGSTNKVQIEFSSTQMRDIKDSLIREFSAYGKGVAEAAMSKVIQDINRGA